MTFLEFAFRHYIGPPQGEYFKCPWCERRNPSIVINKPLGKHRIKFRCVNVACPIARKPHDEFDLVWRFEPHTRYPDRLEIIADLRREYEAYQADQAGDNGSDTHSYEPDETTDGTGAPQQTPRTSLPRGHKAEGSRESCMENEYQQGGVEYKKCIEMVWADWLEYARDKDVPHEELFRLVSELYDHGLYRDLGWFVPNVLAYWEHFIEWVEKTNAHHMARCVDPECEFYCCRAERGLPPIPPPTPEEREEIGRQRAEAEKQQAAFEEDIWKQLVESAKRSSQARNNGRPFRRRFRGGN